MPAALHPATRSTPRRLMLPWPLPALLAWTGAWLCWWLLQPVQAPPWLGLLMALAFAALIALRQATLWRRCLVMGGFPASALVLGMGGAGSPWLWATAVLPLLVLYPVRAWRDAPLFPTPAHALEGLAALIQPPPHHVLDVGSGLGHGLLALRRQWPQAQLSGVEWSRPLAWASAWRCRGAQVKAGDMWAQPWGGVDLVYLFQRPETMARAWRKACSEMPAGRWFVSLEFPVPDVVPHAALQPPGQRPVWVYRIPPAAAPQGPHTSGAPAPGGSTRAKAASSALTGAAPGR